MALDGKTAVVTGGASGIGRAIALRLARDGANVAIWDLDRVGGERVAGEIRELGRRSTVEEVDVALRTSVEAAAGATREALGRPAILVNSAGIGELVPVLAMTEEQWDRMIAVHLKGVFNCTRTLLDGMVAAGWGRVVNISSVAALAGAMGFAHYAAAKAGVIGFTRSLAQEVAASAVTVNAIAPGMIDTPLLRKASLDEETIAAIVQRIPVRRIGTPDDIAAACAYVVSEEASYLTGQVVSPNGGSWV